MATTEDQPVTLQYQPFAEGPGHAIISPTDDIRLFWRVASAQPDNLKSGHPVKPAESRSMYLEAGETLYVKARAETECVITADNHLGL